MVVLRCIGCIQTPYHKRDHRTIILIEQSQAKQQARHRHVRTASHKLDLRGRIYGRRFAGDVNELSPSAEYSSGFILRYRLYFTPAQTFIPFTHPIELLKTSAMMKEREIEQTYRKGHATTNLCIGMLLDDLDNPLRMRRLSPRSGFDKEGDSLNKAKCLYTTNLDKGSKASLALSSLLTFLSSKKKSEVITIEADGVRVAILDTGISLLDHIKRLADNDECQDYLQHVYGGPPDVRFTFLITETYSFGNAKVTTETGIKDRIKMGIDIPVTDAVSHGLSLALPSDSKPVDVKAAFETWTSKSAGTAVKVKTLRTYIIKAVCLHVRMNENEKADRRYFLDPRKRDNFRNIRGASQSDVVSENLQEDFLAFEVEDQELEVEDQE